MESIGLFCAASDRLEASYYDLAGAFGRLVGERGLTLVYGGADSGLMESAARGVKNAGWACGGHCTVCLGGAPAREPLCGRGGTVSRFERP